MTIDDVSGRELRRAIFRNRMNGIRTRRLARKPAGVFTFRGDPYTAVVEIFAYFLNSEKIPRFFRRRISLNPEPIAWRCWYVRDRPGKRFRAEGSKWNSVENNNNNNSNRNNIIVYTGSIVIVKAGNHLTLIIYESIAIISGKSRGKYIVSNRICWVL